MSFFLLQRNGMEKNFGLGKLLEHEVKLLETAMPELKANIQKGEEFVHKN